MVLKHPKMKKVLLVVATAPEIQPLIEQTPHWPEEVEVLITGAGMTATAYSLGKALQQNTYDCIVNVGIAGSFDKSMPLGTVVQITEDSFAELGAEDDEQFLSFGEIGLGDNTIIPEKNVELPQDLQLPLCKAITVNKVHGNERSIAQTIERWHPQVESMEGAAVFFCAQKEQIPVLQVRALSNYVTKRDRSSWQIGLALQNLHVWIHQYLQHLDNYRQ